MRKRSQRLWLIGGAAVLVSGAVALAAVGLKDSVAFFYSPTDLAEKQVVKEGFRARVGGLIAHGSVKTTDDARLVFAITDGEHTTPVSFEGLKPDMFGEGQGMVAEGKFDGHGTLIADKLLTRHDESYMPADIKQVMDDMKKRGAENGLTDTLAKPKPAMPGTFN